MKDDYKEINVFAQEVLKMCENKGFSIAEVMYLPVCLKAEINKQISNKSLETCIIAYFFFHLLKIIKIVLFYVMIIMLIGRSISCH